MSEIKYKPKKGRPLELNEQLIDHIVSFVPRNFIANQVARVACIPRQTLQRWLSFGQKEAEEGIDSLYAQLWVKFEQNKGNAIEGLLNTIIQEGKWQGIWEITQSIDRENFGKDSDLIKEILQNMNKLMNKDVNNGQEMD